MRASDCSDRPALERRRTSPVRYSKMSASRPDASSRPGASTVCSLARSRLRHGRLDCASERSVQVETACSVGPSARSRNASSTAGRNHSSISIAGVPVDEEASTTSTGVIGRPGRRGRGRLLTAYASVVVTTGAALRGCAPPGRDRWGRSWHRGRPGSPVGSGRRPDSDSAYTYARRDRRPRSTTTRRTSGRPGPPSERGTVVPDGPAESLSASMDSPARPSRKSVTDPGCARSACSRR